MDASIFKAQAHRLANHLAQKHGVRLKRASVLEAIAALHGAKDWNTLTAKKDSFWRAILPSKPAPVSLTPTLADLQLETHTDALRMGLNESQTQEITVPYSWLRRHLLLLGPTGVGAHSALELLTVQHVMNGGGLVWLSEAPWSNGWNQQLLQRAAEQVGRAGPEDLTKVPVGALPSAQWLREGLFYRSATEGDNPPDAFASAILGALLQQHENSEGPLSKALPTMVVVQDIRIFEDARWAAAFAQARAFGVLFVIHIGELAALRGLGVEVEQTLLANTGTKLVFRPALSSEAYAQAVMLAQDVGAPSTSAIVDTLNGLGVAEALLADGNAIQRLKTGMVDRELSTAT